MNIFSRKKDTPIFTPERLQARVSTVLGQGIHWIGDLRGTGGVRVEGTMQGSMLIKGLVVIGETGKLICPELKAEAVVVAGTVQGNITCQKLEIRSTGRVWGDVVAVSFSSEDGAFLRGQMRMEERIEIQIEEEQPFDEFEIPVIQPESQEEIIREPVLPEVTQTIAEDESDQPALEQQVSEAKTSEKPKLKSPWSN